MCKLDFHASTTLLITRHAQLLLLHHAGRLQVKLQSYSLSNNPGQNMISIYESNFVMLWTETPVKSVLVHSLKQIVSSTELGSIWLRYKAEIAKFTF